MSPEMSLEFPYFHISKFDYSDDFSDDFSKYTTLVSIFDYSTSIKFAIK